MEDITIKTQLKTALNPGLSPADGKAPKTSIARGIPKVNTFR
jgi:hypothetical protein